MNLKYINKVIDTALANNIYETFDANSGINFDVKLNKKKFVENLEVFMIPDPSIYKMFKKCIENIKINVKDSGLSFERNYFYIRSKLITPSINESFNSFSPVMTNMFFGFINLSDKPIEIQEESGGVILLNPGDINIFNSSSKIKVFVETDSRVLCFNVSAAESLYAQMPNQWIPIF
jgi:hypothetical protein